MAGEQTVAELILRITADAEKLKEELKKADKQRKEFTDESVKDTMRMEKQADSAIDNVVAKTEKGADKVGGAFSSLADGFGWIKDKIGGVLGSVSETLDGMEKKVDKLQNTLYNFGNKISILSAALNASLLMALKLASSMDTRIELEFIRLSDLFDSLTSEIGDYLLPVFRSFIDLLYELKALWDSINPAIKRAVFQFLAMTSAFVALKGAAIVLGFSLGWLFKIFKTSILTVMVLLKMIVGWILFTMVKGLLLAALPIAIKGVVGVALGGIAKIFIALMAIKILIVVLTAGLLLWAALWIFDVGKVREITEGVVNVLTMIITLLGVGKDIAVSTYKLAVGIVESGITLILDLVDVAIKGVSVLVEKALVQFEQFMLALKLMKDEWISFGEAWDRAAMIMNTSAKKGVSSVEELKFSIKNLTDDSARNFNSLVEKFKVSGFNTINAIEEFMSAYEEALVKIEEGGTKGQKWLSKMAHWADIAKKKFFELKAILEEFEKSTDKNKKSWDKFVVGMKIGLDATLKSFGDWGDKGKELASTYASGMQDMFQTFFFDAMTNNLQTLGDYFASWGRMILQVIAKVIAEMIVLFWWQQMVGIASATAGASPGGAAPAGGGVMHLGGIIKAHKGLALGEVPIIAQTGEGVLSRRGMSALGGSQNLDSLNKGQSVKDDKGDTYIIAPSFQLWTAEDVHRNRGVITDVIADAIERNSSTRKSYQDI